MIQFQYYFKDVANVRQTDGFEIVQDVVSSHMIPTKQLKGFKKVFIKRSETITVSLKLHISELYLVDKNEEYIVEPGEFMIIVGADSRDKSLLKESFEVK